MKLGVVFLSLCTRLLGRQGLPFVNEFPERQHYQGLIAACVHVCVHITCQAHICRERTPLIESKERRRNRGISRENCSWCFSDVDCCL